MPDPRDPAEKVRDVCRDVLPKEVCDKVRDVIKDRGIEIVREPKTIIRPEPVFKDGKLDGGKITIEIQF